MNDSEIAQDERSGASTAPYSANLSQNPAKSYALIAGTVSYPHIHPLVAVHGQLGWVAAQTQPGNADIAERAIIARARHAVDTL